MRAALRRCTIATLAVAAATTASSAVAAPGPAGSGKQVPVPSARFTWSMPDRYDAGWQAWDAGARPMTRATCARSPGRSTSTRAAPRAAGRRSAATTSRSGASRGTSSARPTARRAGAGFASRSWGATTSAWRSGRRPDERTARRADRRPRLADRVARRLDGVGGGRARSAGRVLRRFPRTPSQLDGAPRRPAASAVTSYPPVRWQDQRCHRSARSGHALAAEALERDDAQSSVTFVSLACSGAEIRHLISESYEGMQPDGRVLAPQIDELARLVGVRVGSRGRRIDSLLLSAGINDLSFSDIVKRCAGTSQVGVHLTEHCVESVIRACGKVDGREVDLDGDGECDSRWKLLPHSLRPARRAPRACARRRRGLHHGLPGRPVRLLRRLRPPRASPGRHHRERGPGDRRRGDRVLLGDPLGRVCATAGTASAA